MQGGTGLESVSRQFHEFTLGECNRAPARSPISGHYYVIARLLFVPHGLRSFLAYLHLYPVPTRRLAIQRDPVITRDRAVAAVKTLASLTHVRDYREGDCHLCTNL